MKKITPFLWFEKGAEDAAAFYVDVFNGNPGMKKKSKLGSMTHYNSDSSNASRQPKGSVMTVSFELEGEPYTAINGGPFLKMSGGVSFVIHCATQEEVDYFWEKLGENGGEPGDCGWINHDRYGLTWQVVPDVMIEYLGGDDEEGAARAMKAMLTMHKLDIAALKKAYEG